MARNKLNDLNDHLFQMIENLNDDELCSDPKETAKIVARAKAIEGLSNQIISIQSVQLHALEVAEKCGYMVKDLPSSLALEKN